MSNRFVKFFETREMEIMFRIGGYLYLISAVLSTRTGNGDALFLGSGLFVIIYFVAVVVPCAVWRRRNPGRAIVFRNRFMARIWRGELKPAFNMTAYFVLITLIIRPGYPHNLWIYGLTGLMLLFALTAAMFGRHDEH